MEPATKRVRMLRVDERRVRPLNHNKTFNKPVLYCA